MSANPQESRALTIRTQESLAVELDRREAALLAVLPKTLTVMKLRQVVLFEAEKNPKLLECTPASLIGAVVECAKLGLMPGTLGHAYLVPMYNRKKGALECQMWPGYPGLIDLIVRSGKVSAVWAHAVFERDEFEEIGGSEPSIRHIPHRGAGRGEILAFYAVAKFRDGAIQFEVMAKAEVDAIREKSPGKDSDPWRFHYEAMGRKTAIRRLAKYLPKSVELDRALELDDRADLGEDQDIAQTLEADYTEASDSPPAATVAATVERSDGSRVDTATGEVLPPEGAWQMTEARRNAIFDALKGTPVTAPQLQAAMERAQIPADTTKLSQVEYQRVFDLIDELVENVAKSKHPF